MFYNKKASNLAATGAFSFIRQRFELIKKTGQHNCVWTDKSLQKEYAIDHCMPFSFWPNNDLWNLLPSDVKAKGQKSDRLPTESKMKNAKNRIIDWWTDAWLEPVADSLKSSASSPEPKR